MIDSEILQGFIEETKSYLPDIWRGVEAYSQDSKCVSELENAQRQIHTIKGAAMMMGLNEISNFCAEIKDEIEKVIASNKAISKKQTQLLLDKISNLEAALSLAGESADFVSFENESFNEELFGDFAAEATDSVTSSPTDSEFEDFEIDAEMLEVFAMEAEDHLKNIGTNLNLLEQNPNNREALLEIRRSAHTLKGSAGIVGFKKLSSLAHRVEDLLDFIAENEIESNSQIFELLLASTVCLEELTNGQNSPEINRKIAEIYQRFEIIMASLQTAKILASKDSIVLEPIPSKELIHLITTNNPVETPEIIEPQTQTTDSQNRSIIRVSLERLDDLVKLVSEMVISRSVFEQRLLELEHQIQEINHINNRLRNSTGKLEMDYVGGFSKNKGFNSPTFGFNSPNVNSLFAKEFDEFDILEFDQYTEFHQTTRELIETTGDTSAIHNGLESLYDNFGSLFETQRRLVEEMQTSLLRLRMVPLSSLSTRLHRTVRVTATDEGKLVDLEIENEAIEIDTQILDSFIEPLIHILRNAVAHGIEPPETRRLLGKSEKGKITLRAYSEGTHIVFVISDDGRGISASSLKQKALEIGFISQKEVDSMSDEQAFSLIFLPGLSTAEKIDEISGRGVGMNVVKSNITRRHGKISIKSELQKGTSFTIRLPMSLAVTRALLVQADEQSYAFPLKLVKQVTEISLDELEKITKEKVFNFNGISYSFIHFNELLNLPITANPINTMIPLLLMEASETPCAMAVEKIIKPEEIVIKPLGTLFKDVHDIIGATILGDGSVVPVLDLVHLINKTPTQPSQIRPKPIKVKSKISILIVDDSPSVRQVNANLVKNLGWQAVIARDGLEALDILQTFRELPDIILTDVEMPRMDGYELLAALKKQANLQSIPVIMITSRTGDKHRRKAFDLGVSEYLTKPYQESILIERIKLLANIA